MKRFFPAAAVAATLLAACSPAPKGPVARTDGGQVVGEAEKGIVSWKGIPFAAPPIGELRWRAPQPVPGWTDLRNAHHYGNDCMQVPFAGDSAPLRTEPSEDCLYLNVWKPEHAKGKLPVIVWIHGGGFLNGGTSPAIYDGSALARKGVMVVSFNYRLGRFGTFAHPRLIRAAADNGLLGNYGAMDQVAALKWVQANIAAFGGDPGNVTLIGESAGGMSVHMMLTSPLTEGLFQRAVVMSGGDGTTIEESTGPKTRAMSLAFAQTQGITPNDPDALTKLRKLSAGRLAEGLNLETLFGGPKPPFSSPYFDGRVLVDQRTAYEAGAFNQVPVMIGATSGDLQGPDGFMIKGARDMAGLLAKAGVPVYAYRFSYVASSLKDKLAGHASDIPYFFDTQGSAYKEAVTARDNAMGGTISDALVAFARTGNPNHDSLPEWPRYDPAKDVIMDFATDGRARVGRDPLTVGGGRGVSPALSPAKP